ncbi:MAG: ATP-binding protein [Opitutaceae bacterium]
MSPAPGGGEPWLPREFGTPRLFATGELLFSAGEEPAGRYIIDSGRIEVFVTGEGGEPRMLAELGPNDTVGEMAVLDDVPRSASARAAMETQTRFLGRRELLYLLERRPAIALGFIREFIHRMRAINRRYFDDIVQAERLATVGRFTRTIVHDFKNPLATIRWTSELASAEDTPAATRQSSHERILRQVERMQTMLHELIEFTRPGGQKPVLQPGHLATFLRAFAEEAGADLAARQVRIELEPLPGPTPVRMDPQRLSRLLHNLCNNAVDAMPRGGRIMLRLRVRTDAAELELEDTGPGIPAAVADRLFTPFATHGKAGGTGLGLSICRRIAEDHGGTISVAPPEPGRGARFVLTLPLAAAAS